MGTYSDILITRRTLVKEKYAEELAKWMHENLMEVMEKPSTEGKFIEVKVRKFKRRNHRDQQNALANKLKDMEEVYNPRTYGAFNPQVFVRGDQSDKFSEWDWKEEVEQE